MLHVDPRSVRRQPPFRMASIAATNRATARSVVAASYFRLRTRAQREVAHSAMTADRDRCFTIQRNIAATATSTARLSEKARASSGESS